MRTAIPAFAASILVAAPAVAHGPFDGFWAADPAWCDADMAGTPEAPIMVDLPIIEFALGQCIIESFEAVGTGDGDAWRARVSCTGEGDEWEHDSIFAVGRDADGAPQTLIEIELEYGIVQIYRRCP